MTGIFLAIEITGILVAAFFGVMWLRDPNGPYEPATFLALLVGSSVVEIVRRHLPVRRTTQQSDPTVETLTRRVEELLGVLENEQDSTVIGANVAISSGSEDASQERDAPDRLTNIIVKLLESRNAVVDKITALAKVRGISVAGLKPSDIAARLQLPGPFSDATARVLQFTEALERRAIPDIEHSGWVYDMAAAVVTYIDVLIEGSQEKRAVPAKL